MRFMSVSQFERFCFVKRVGGLCRDCHSTVEHWTCASLALLASHASSSQVISAIDALHKKRSEFAVHYLSEALCLLPSQAKNTQLGYRKSACYIRGKI